MCEHDTLTKTAKTKGVYNRKIRKKSSWSKRFAPILSAEVQGKERQPPFMISWHERAVGKRRRGASRLASCPSVVLSASPLPGGTCTTTRPWSGAPLPVGSPG